ncbi:hypothetical protein Hanom_Chr09g00867771 [Helianthus anomalus]
MIKPQLSVLLLLISQSTDMTFVLIRVVKWGNGAKHGKYRWYENGSNGHNKDMVVLLTYCLVITICKFSY